MLHDNTGITVYCVPTGSTQVRTHWGGSSPTLNPFELSAVQPDLFFLSPSGSIVLWTSFLILCVYLLKLCPSTSLYSLDNTPPFTSDL